MQNNFKLPSNTITLIIYDILFLINLKIFRIIPTVSASNIEYHFAFSLLIFHDFTAVKLMGQIFWYNVLNFVFL